MRRRTGMGRPEAKPGPDVWSFRATSVRCAMTFHAERWSQKSDSSVLRSNREHKRFGAVSVEVSGEHIYPHIGKFHIKCVHRDSDSGNSFYVASGLAKHRCGALYSESPKSPKSPWTNFIRMFLLFAYFSMSRFCRLRQHGPT